MRNEPRRHCLIALSLLLALAGVGIDASAKEKPDNTRVLVGKVLDHQDRPLTNAVVYLSNTRTRAVKTYIVGTDGTYRFPALSPNTDYEVYAQYQERKSETKTVSQFDDRPTVNIVLRIDTK